MMFSLSDKQFFTLTKTVLNYVESEMYVTKCLLIIFNIVNFLVTSKKWKVYYNISAYQLYLLLFTTGYRLFS